MEAVALTPIAQPADKVWCPERRTHCRFKVQSGAMCSLQLPVVGQITDVSLGGLSFQYVSSRVRSKESPVLRISSTDGTFELGMIPFNAVWDRPGPQATSSDLITLRECGVQFGELTDEQRFDLKWFLKSYT